jgi:hypothetical protein
MRGTTTTYEIDGARVTKAAFERFAKTLQEISGTWYCAETNDGGRTGYDAEDAAGARYAVCGITDAKGTRETIRKSLPG